MKLVRLTGALSYRVLLKDFGKINYNLEHGLDGRKSELQEKMRSEVISTAKRGVVAMGVGHRRIHK